MTTTIGIFYAKTSRKTKGGLRNVDLREPLTDHPLNQGRVAWWLVLPQRYGGSVWYDLVGNLLGAFTNFPPGYGWNPQTYPGGAGSLLLNGTSSYVTGIGPSIANTPFTVLMRFTCTNLTTQQPYVFCYGLVPSNDQFIQCGPQSSATVLQFGMFFDDLQLTVPSMQNKVVHYAATLAANKLQTLTARVDGPQAYTSSRTASSFFVGGQNFDIGKYSPSSVFFGGYVYYVSLYNRALSAQEIALDYELGLQGFPGVLRRRQRAITAPSAAPATSFRPIAAYLRQQPVLGVGVF